jgi:MFS superfamily sulfate permease-like transporter
LVQLPVYSTLTDFAQVFVFPDFTFLSNPNVYVLALTIALVGSLETLLSVEATEKMDPKKQSTPTNRELKAQGIGNMFVGFIGGLPITQVIVRSSANISTGGQTKASTIFHGFFLLIAITIIPNMLNLIPLASLAAILMVIGYKLANFKLFKQMYRLGYEHFIPFIAIILGVLFTDLLKGIAIGMAFSFFFIIRKNFLNNNTKVKYNGTDELDGITIELPEELTFLNKGKIKVLLRDLPKNSTVTIDGTRCQTIDYDVMELLKEFVDTVSVDKGITVHTKSINGLVN